MLSLARPISDALGQIRGVLEPTSAFDPATASRRLSIAVTDYGDLVVVQPLVEALRGLRVSISWCAPSAIRPRASRALNAAMSTVDRRPPPHLHAHHPVHVVRGKVRLHSGRQTRQAVGPTHQGRLHASSAYQFASTGGDGLPGAIDTMLTRHGRKRRTAITLAHVVAVPFAVAGTDLVATWPSVSSAASLQPPEYPSFRFPMTLRHSPSTFSTRAALWPTRRCDGSLNSSVVFARHFDKIIPTKGSSRETIDCPKRERHTCLTSNAFGRRTNRGPATPPTGAKLGPLKRWVELVRHGMEPLLAVDIADQPA
jgi:hypothetical protein